MPHTFVPVDHAIVGIVDQVHVEPLPNAQEGEAKK